MLLTNADMVESRFSQVMASIASFESCPVMAVAVSGGSDSMALAYLAQTWVLQHGGSIVAVTVDHGLRTESAEEAKKVHHLLAEAGIEHHTLHWDTPKPASNLQSEARTARYDLMADWCKARNILHLLVAHHLDDQAETFMIRLERGSGIDGLSCMPAVSAYKTLRVLRPLLSLSKCSLREYLRHHHYSWIEDPSNMKTYYTRNRIRKVLSAEDELLTQRLATTAYHLGRARASLDMSTAKALVHTVKIFPEGYALLDVRKFAHLAEEEGLHILASLLSTIGGHVYKPRFASLSALFGKIKGDHLTGATLWGCKITPLKNKEVLISREPSAIEPDVDVEEGVWKYWDNRFSFRVGKLTHFPSLHVGRLRMEEWRLIREEVPSLNRIILPKQVLITLPTLKSLDSVLAIPHIGYYRENITAEAFSCWFRPRVALTCMPFHYENYIDRSTRVISTSVTKA